MAQFSRSRFFALLGKGFNERTLSSDNKQVQELYDTLDANAGFVGIRKESHRKGRDAKWLHQICRDLGQERS